MAKKSALTWRVNDIVVASVLAVACGLLFWLWSNIGFPVTTAALALAPEYSPLMSGVWLLGGVLGGYVIRKPGAALYIELLGAIVSGLLGTEYSWTVVLSGLLQGIGAEIIFAIFVYKVWNLGTAMLAGAAAGAIGGFSEVVIYYASEMVGAKAFIYTACCALSGAVVAGILAWALTTALAKTGVLATLASGLTARRA